DLCKNASAHWNDLHIGGWGGGACEPGHVARIPVVLVHGNTSDAWFWRAEAESGDGSLVNVRQRFLDAGYCPNEIWGISYAGEASPRGSYGSGYTTYADINAEETYAFLRAVMSYTGSDQVDVVGHSLGATVLRKAMFLHRNDPAADNPYSFVRRAVMIAGGNHGTTGCRLGTIHHINHVCEEHDPGSPWLDELNGIGESPGPTRWMSICECTGLVDQGYLLLDAESPLLEGSIQVRLPFTGHVMLARGQIGVDAYLPFLIEGTQLASAASGTSAQAPVRFERRAEAARPGISLPATGLARVSLSWIAALFALASAVAVIRVGIR
ncbi:MAG: alpha/beta fold hydrolase, partial [Actinomycetota bacterium]